MVDLYDIWIGDVIPESGTAISLGRNTYDGAAPTVPVHDIHSRQLNFHDSGDPGGSGIVQYNAEKNVLQLNPGNSGVQNVTTAVCFDAYDDAGGGSIGTTVTVVNIDTERYNSHPDVFVLAADEVQINMSGVYEINYRASANNATTTRTNALWALQRQEPGGSFAEIDGSRGYSYHRTSGNGTGSSFGKAIISHIGVGDKIRLIGIITAGTSSISSIADGSSLTIRKLG